MTQKNQINQMNQMNLSITLGIWIGILSVLLHSILDSNLSIIPANTIHLCFDGFITRFNKFKNFRTKNILKDGALKVYNDCTVYPL